MQDTQDNGAMSMQTFLDYLFTHNESLIETLIGVILFILAYAFYRWFLSPQASEATAVVPGMPDLSHLEESLKQILEKAAQVPASSAGPGDPALMTEIGQLKKTLQDRQSQIDDLKTQVESGTQTQVSAPTPGMSPPTLAPR